MIDLTHLGVSDDDVEQVTTWLVPYIHAAELALQCGAIGLPKVENPTRTQVVEVMIQLLGETGEIDGELAAALRRALLDPEGRRFLNQDQES